MRAPASTGSKTLEENKRAREQENKKALAKRREPEYVSYRLYLKSSVCTFALQVVEDDFTQTHRLGRYLHIFVLLDVLERFLQ